MKIKAVSIISILLVALLVFYKVAFAAVTVDGQSIIQTILTILSQTKVQGTYSVEVADNPTVEFDVLTLDLSSGEFWTYSDITVDLEKATTGFDAVATAGDTITFRLYQKIDGTNYREVDNAIYTAGSITCNVLVSGNTTAEDMKVTAQTSADRGAFDLPYLYSKKVQ